MDGNSSTDTRSGRASVYLAVGEDTDVAAVATRLRRWPHEDDPVEKPQVGIAVRVRNVKLVGHTSFDFSPQVHEFGNV